MIYIVEQNPTHNVDNMHSMLVDNLQIIFDMGFFKNRTLIFE